MLRFIILEMCGSLNIIEVVAAHLQVPVEREECAEIRDDHAKQEHSS